MSLSKAGLFDHMKMMQKVSYHLGNSKWYFLHKHLLWTETWNNYGDQMAHLNDAKMGGEMFYGHKNDLVIYQDF